MQQCWKSHVTVHIILSQNTRGASSIFTFQLLLSVYYYGRSTGEKQDLQKQTGLKTPQRQTRCVLEVQPFSTFTGVLLLCVFETCTGSSLRFHDRKIKVAL